MQVVGQFFANRKPVAAICHAAWTLIEADVVRGRRMTSFPSLATDLRNAGAEWVDEEVVVDDGLVTSRNPDDLPAFCRALVEEFAKDVTPGARARELTAPPLRAAARREAGGPARLIRHRRTEHTSRSGYSGHAYTDHPGRGGRRPSWPGSASRAAAVARHRPPPPPAPPPAPTSSAASPVTPTTGFLVPGVPTEGTRPRHGHAPPRRGARVRPGPRRDARPDGRSPWARRPRASSSTR